MNLTNKKDLSIKNITSIECFNKLSEISNSYLIDIRTKPEWEFIGVPDLSSLNKKTIFISWNMYPEMKINSLFENQITESNIKKNDNIFLICRSGNRSSDAAEFLTSLGFTNCFNVKDGFEGEIGHNHQRSTINGWKYSKLPWKQ